MIIKTWRDPYDAGFSPTRPKEIELHTGVTVLVGCNGSGKSTLLKNINEHCKKNNIPCNLYDNLKDGGSNSLGELFSVENFSEVSYLMSASEGEGIKANLGRNSTFYKEFFKNGYINNRTNRLSMLFDDKKAEKLATFKNCKDRVLLFDAVDSGLSVDSIIEVKEMFNAILEDIPNYNVNIYIIIAANEYELARNSDCFDVNSGKYLKFYDYEDYRDFIIKSRLKKETRIRRQSTWRKKHHDKEVDEYKKLLIIYNKKYDEFIKSVKDPNNLSWSEKSNLEHLRYELDDFKRCSRFISKSEFEELENS